MVIFSKRARLINLKISGIALLVIKKKLSKRLCPCHALRQWSMVKVVWTVQWETVHVPKYILPISAIFSPIISLVLLIFEKPFQRFCCLSSDIVQEEQMGEGVSYKLIAVYYKILNCHKKVSLIKNTTK